MPHPFRCAYASHARSPSTGSWTASMRRGAQTPPPVEVIFTDQDPALAAAIKEAFPDARLAHPGPQPCWQYEERLFEDDLGAFEIGQAEEGWEVVDVQCDCYKHKARGRVCLHSFKAFECYVFRKEWVNRHHHFVVRTADSRLDSSLPSRINEEASAETVGAWLRSVRTKGHVLCILYRSTSGPLRCEALQRYRGAVSFYQSLVEVIRARGG
eukprot:56794-Eustigmatos_ZCMA.PRE.5